MKGKIDNLPEPEYRTVQVNCPIHGEMQINQVRVFGEFRKPVCPVCEKEVEEAEIERKRQAQAIVDANSRQRHIRDSLGRAAIPPRFAEKSFLNFLVRAEGEKSALAECKKYAEDFPENLKIGRSLILCGNMGTGKTHLACAIANYAIQKHASTALFMRVSNAMRAVKETFRKDSQARESEVISQFKMVDLLILDEVGVQYGTETEMHLLFDIINDRYERLKPTIIISNLNLKGVKDFIGDRCLDRLKENGGKAIIFDWESSRI